MAQRTYADAIAALNTLQSNSATVELIKKTGRVKYDQAIPEFSQWCRRIGYDPADFNSLNPIHIAGTKGKGSTAAFISSILSKFISSPVSQSSDTDKDGVIKQKSVSKVGLYTSPHLRFVRERIQINNAPLSESLFTKYFFETWDRLETAAKQAGQNVNAPGVKPMYFNFLTLMAFHVYMSEEVDAAIIECGIGGRYDVTNVVQQPRVTGITNLELDHVHVLGKTLPEIAWQKAGIIKPSAKCYTTSTQADEAKDVLEKCAKEVGTELVYVDIDPKIASGETKIGLEAEFQKINASLAVAIAKDWLAQHGYTSQADFEDKIAKGLTDVKWAGRCETRHEPDLNLTWFIDGGHTLTSIRLAGEWYANSILHSHSQTPKTSTSSPKRFLIFNQQTRDASALARALHQTLASTLHDASPFTCAVFCTNTTYASSGFKPDLISMNTSASDVEELKVQKELAEVWSEIDSRAEVVVVRTIEEAIDVVRQAAREGESANETSALVTGSLHLVGGVLEVMEGKDV